MKRLADIYGTDALLSFHSSKWVKSHYEHTALYRRHVMILQIVFILFRIWKKRGFSLQNSQSSAVLRDCQLQDQSSTGTVKIPFTMKRL